MGLSLELETALARSAALASSGRGTEFCQVSACLARAASSLLMRSSTILWS